MKTTQSVEILLVTRRETNRGAGMKRRKDRACFSYDSHRILFRSQGLTFSLLDETTQSNEIPSLTRKEANRGAEVKKMEDEACFLPTYDAYFRHFILSLRLPALSGFVGASPDAPAKKGPYFEPPCRSLATASWAASWSHPPDWGAAGKFNIITWTKCGRVMIAAVVKPKVCRKVELLPFFCFKEPKHKEKVWTGGGRLGSLQL